MSEFEVPPERLGAWLRRWAARARRASAPRRVPGMSRSPAPTVRRSSAAPPFPPLGPAAAVEAFAPDGAARPRDARPHRRRPARAPRRLRGGRLPRQAPGGLQGRPRAPSTAAPAREGRARSATSAAATASRGSPTTRRRRPGRGSCCATSTISRRSSSAATASRWRACSRTRGCASSRGSRPSACSTSPTRVSRSCARRRTATGRRCCAPWTHGEHQNLAHRVGSRGAPRRRRLLGVGRTDLRVRRATRRHDRPPRVELRPS